MWHSPFFLTCQLVIGAAVIAGIFGTISAWALAMLDSPALSGSSGASGRKSSDLITVLAAAVFRTSLVAALAVPMVLHAAAWESAAGKFGWLALTQTGARRGAGYDFGGLWSVDLFSGLVAPVWIHGVHGIAIVALAVWFGAGRMPSAAARQSRLDAGVAGGWWRIRLPHAIGWLVGSLLLVALLATTEMTVVDLYGVQTLADEFYLYNAADPSGATIAKVCMMPLLIGAILLWVVRSSLRGVDHSAANQTAFDGPDEVPVSRPSAGVRWIAISIATLVVLLVLGVPLVSLLVKAGHTVERDDLGVRVGWTMQWMMQTLSEAPLTFRSEYLWTGVIGVSAGMIAAVIAWVLAAIGCTRTRFRGIVDLVTVGCCLLPGPVVGLAVVSLFQFDFLGAQTLYQETLVPTLLALQFRAIPAAYWVLRLAYRNLGSDVLRAASLEMGLVRRIWRIDRPLLQGGLFAAAVSASVVASGDVPTMLPVLPPGVSTVGTRLFGLLHSGSRYQEASLAIWYMIAVVVIVTMVPALWRRQLWIRR